MNLKYALKQLIKTLIIGCFIFAFFCSHAQSLPKRIVLYLDSAENLGNASIGQTFQHLQKAESLATNETLSAIMARSLWIKAKSYYQLRSYDTLGYLIEAGIEQAEKVGDYLTLSKLYNLSGVITKRNGNYGESINAYTLGLQYGVRSGDSLAISKTLLNLGNVYRNLGNRDSALWYFKKSINIKRNLNDTLSLARSISSLGNYYLSGGNPERALEQYKIVMPLYQSMGFITGLARVSNNIGAVYRQMGFYTMALKSYMKSLSFNDSLGFRLESANSLSNIATIFKAQSEYSESLKYFCLAFDIYEELDESMRQADVYMNMADVWLYQNERTKALRLLKQVEAIYLNLGTKTDLANLFHGYGRAYSGMGQVHVAMDYFEKALKLKQEVSDAQGLANVHNSLAVSFYEQLDFQAAVDHYSESYIIGQKIESPVVMRSSLLGLSEVYAALGHSEQAYDYRLRYGVLKDSLDNVKKSRQIAELREIYETEKKDKQITQLELENKVVNAQSEANAALAAEQRADKLTFIVLGAALLILTIILYVYLKQRLLLARLKEKEEKEAHIKAVNELLVQEQTKTLEAMVEGQEQERLRIARELHDHFGSLMAAVKVNLTTVVANGNVDHANDEQMKNLSVLVDQACEDIRSLSHSMHVGVSESFGLIPALKDLAHSVSTSGSVEVAFQSASCAGKLDSTIEVIAYRLIQELVSNALKHAQATKLTLQVTCLDEIVNIMVEDNGRGFDAQHYMEQSQGMGLKSIQERIMSLRGEFEVDSQPGKGTTVIIDLPVSVEQRMITL